MLKSIFKAVAVSAVAAVFSIGCGGDGGNSTGGGGGGGGGASGLTVTGLPDSEIWWVYVFPAGTDISNYVSFALNVTKVEASNGGGNTGNLFPLARWTAYGPDGTPWKGSGNRAVLIGEGMAAYPAYWATVNFSNGNATVPFSSFTPVPDDNTGGGGGGETKSSYTITFDANGGTVSPTSGKTGDDGKLASLPTPTRSGYTFDGWFTSSSGGTAVTVSNVYSANTTIYARWTAAGSVGAGEGWPPSGILSEYGVGGLTEPSGTTIAAWTATGTQLILQAITMASFSYFEDYFTSNGWTFWSFVSGAGRDDSTTAGIWEKSSQSQSLRAICSKDSSNDLLEIYLSFF
jgi:uncharacterized repeat protein (TIGR02543 family)